MSGIKKISLHLVSHCGDPSAGCAFFYFSYFFLVSWPLGLSCLSPFLLFIRHPYPPSRTFFIASNYQETKAASVAIHHESKRRRQSTRPEPGWHVPAPTSILRYHHKRIRWCKIRATIRRPPYNRGLLSGSAHTAAIRSSSWSLYPPFWGIRTSSRSVTCVRVGGDTLVLVS